MNANNEAAKDLMNMTADSIGRDLLGTLVQEIKLLPEPWAKTPKAKQDDVIERLRKSVETGVRMAVHLLASERRATISANVDQVTIKDGIKAVLTLGKNDPNRHALCDAQGLPVLIIVANPADHTGGMDEIKGESDQRAMNLGHEYNTKAEDKGIGEAKKKAAESATDAVVKLIGQAADEQTKAEHYEAGRKARRDGKAKEQAPLVSFELVAQWTQGWSDQDRDIADGVVDAEFTPAGTDAGTDSGAGSAQDKTAGGNADASTDAPPPAKLSAHPGATTRVPVKFRNPETGETWTGRGLKPAWVTKALSEGKTLEDLLDPTAKNSNGLSAD